MKHHNEQADKLGPGVYSHANYFYTKPSSVAYTIKKPQPSDKSLSKIQPAKGNFYVNLNPVHPPSRHTRKNENQSTTVKLQAAHPDRRLLTPVKLAPKKSSLAPNAALRSESTQQCNLEQLMLREKQLIKFSSPGPGHYYNERQTSTFKVDQSSGKGSSSFGGAANRLSPAPASNQPGPGHYNSVTENSQQGCKFSKSIKESLFIKEYLKNDTPGIGKYS